MENASQKVTTSTKKDYGIEYDITYICFWESDFFFWNDSWCGTSICVPESRAISRYVCDKYANQGNKQLYGTNPLEKASIDQWLEAEGQNFNPPSSILVFQLAFAPRMKIKQDENLIKQNKAKLAKVLDVYERRLGESEYLAGDDFTLADLSHLSNTQYLVNATDREELFASRKNVERWWDQISTRESWKKVVEMQKSPASH